MALQRHFFRGGERLRHVRAHDKNGRRPNETAIGLDKAEEACDKEGQRGCCICRTRSVLPFRSCWSFRGIPAAAGCVPIVDCPAMVGWPWPSDGSGGALVNISRAPPLPKQKPGLVMEANVPSSRLEVRGGLAMELGVSMGLSWWAWPRWDCPDPLPRWCAVQSLEWRTAAAMRLSSWSSAAQCKPDLSSVRRHFAGMVKRTLIGYGQGNKNEMVSSTLRLS